MPDPDTQEIRWYQPNPRAIFPLNGFIISRSLRRSMRNRGYTCTIDKCFADVMLGCADREETWINEEFLSAYQQLHREGSAHSIEVWKEQDLVGGVYGVHLGGAFFAESMFMRLRDASKVALAYLVDILRANHFTLLEVQFLTDHLASLGAIPIDHGDYLRLLDFALKQNCRFQLPESPTLGTAVKLEQESP